MALRFNMYPTQGQEIYEWREKQSGIYRDIGRGLAAGGREYGDKYSPKAREYQKYVSGIEKDTRDFVTNAAGDEVPNPNKGQPLYAAMTRDVWEGSDEGKFAISEMKKGRRTKFGESALGKLLMEKTGGVGFGDTLTEEGQQKLHEDIITGQREGFSKSWDEYLGGGIPGAYTGFINWIAGRDVWKGSGNQQIKVQMDLMKKFAPERYDRLVQEYYKENEAQYQKYLTGEAQESEYKFNPFEGLQKAGQRRRGRKAGRELFETQEAEEKAGIIADDKVKFMEENRDANPSWSDEKLEEEWERYKENIYPEKKGLLGRLKTGYKEKIGDPWREGIVEQKGEIAAEKKKEQDLLMKLFRPKTYKQGQAIMSSGILGFNKNMPNYHSKVQSSINEFLSTYPKLTPMSFTEEDYAKFQEISDSGVTPPQKVEQTRILLSEILGRD